MNGMASAARAKFLNRELLTLALFVFAGNVVAPFAAVALETDKISHLYSPMG